ncbi:MAG TPA: hypothetical protein VFM18_18070 [Methanosarcina sp.]|nr:hypothetical protein [Methanosarcina sp.]
MNYVTEHLAEQSGWPKDTHVDDLYQVVGPMFADKFSTAIIEEAIRYLDERAYVEADAGNKQLAASFRVAMAHLKYRFGLK